VQYTIAVGLTIRDESSSSSEQWQLSAMVKMTQKMKMIQNLSRVGHLKIEACIDLHACDFS
jgi:hypothetical protein